MHCPFCKVDNYLTDTQPILLDSCANCVVYACKRGHVYERVDGHARLLTAAAGTR